MRKRILNSIVLSLLCLLASPAAAQVGACGPKDQMLDILLKDHGEKPVASGLTQGDPQLLMLLSLNDKTGSWTFSMLSATGLFCLISAGKDFGTNLPDLKNSGPAY